jgi:hypothetical protein
MIFVCLSLLSPKNGAKLINRSNAHDSVIAYVLLMVDGVVANFSLHNFAVIGIGLLTMIAFVVIAIYNTKKDTRLERPSQVSR